MLFDVAFLTYTEVTVPFVTRKMEQLEEEPDPFADDSRPLSHPVQIAQESISAHYLEQWSFFNKTDGDSFQQYGVNWLLSWQCCLLLNTIAHANCESCIALKAWPEGPLMMEYFRLRAARA